MKEQFDILLPLVLAGEASADQEKTFFELLEKNGEWETEYREALRIWMAASSLGYRTDDALQKVQPHTGRVIAMKPRRWRIPAIAASVLLLAGLFTWALWKNAATADDPFVGPQVVTIQAGDEVKMVHLPDSSVVWLNRHSEISYPERFAGNERRVSLKGEAYFDVVSDKSKPFITQTPSSVTRVLGTEYNLKETGDRCELNVTEGLVNFSRIVSDHYIAVKAGSSAVLDKDMQVPRHIEADPNFLAWKTRIMTFKAAPLDYMLHVMQAVYGHPYKVRGNIADIRFTGSFRDIPEKDAHLIISESLGLNFSDSSGTVWVTDKP